MTRFPEWICKIEDVSTDGTIDEAKVRQALKDWQDAGFIMWGDDSRPVLALAVEFLRQLAAVTRNVEIDERTDAHTHAQSEADERLVRRYERGRIAFTRFDFDAAHGALRVRVSCANPREVPGTALESARRFAVYACRILACIKREIEASNANAKISLEGVGDLHDVFDEAEWTDRKMVERDKVDAANEARAMCVRRLGGYCSPSDPGCRCYCDGKCVSAVLPAEYKIYKRRQS